MPTTKQERSVDTTESARTTSPADEQETAYRGLVRRVVASPTFARSERLCALLRYVCDMALKGREGELNEQRIGQAVFGRSPDYDSSIDGIVRTQASRLRQRLELYFDHEGVGEPVQIIIPKGGYIPVFAPRPLKEPQMPRPLEEVTVQENQSASTPPINKASSSLAQRVPWILCAMMAVALAILLIRSRSRTPETLASSSRHPLWSQIFTQNQPTLDVPADSGLVLSHVFDGVSIPLSEYLTGSYRTMNGIAEAPPLSSEIRHLRTEISNRRYTSIVDLEAAVKLAELARSFRTNLQVRYARDLRPNDLKSGNVILVGAFEANPWVELFEPNMNFVLRNDYKAKIFSVINKAPATGEPVHWDSELNDPQHRVYGIVAFLPNLSGNGNALLIEGTSMAGTEAAWDFIADDSELLPFLKRIQRPNGEIPHFELLLGTQNMSSSAVHSNVLTWRVKD